MRRVLSRDRLASRREPGRRPVAIVPIAQSALDGLEKVRRRLKAKGAWVPDVQVADLLARGLHPLRLDNDVADGVGELANAARDRNGDMCRTHLAILQRRASQHGPPRR